jgi:hypothetical protein
MELLSFNAAKADLRIQRKLRMVLAPILILFGYLGIQK